MVAQRLKHGMDEERMSKLLAFGEEIVLKFELTDGGLTWESMPGVEHQRLIYGIQRSMGSAPVANGRFGCRQIAELDIAFPDGTVKRPDISVWCEWPKELEGFVHGPPIYLRNGIKDVIVLDRAKGEVQHWGRTATASSPRPSCSTSRAVAA